MHANLFHRLLVTSVGAMALGGSDGLVGTVDAAPPQKNLWHVVVNNGFEVPGNPGRFYDSYNPPSVNADALVVFRARSAGQQQGTLSGIYLRDMMDVASQVRPLADRDTIVPEPNNTEYPVPGGGISFTRLATFNEFPAFPRIAQNADAVASRANHPPVWTFVPAMGGDALAAEGEDDSTRAGTTGVYVSLHAMDPQGALVTGASLVGAVPEFSEIFGVPGLVPATRFDVFPGAPAITDDGIVAFKANYTTITPAAGGAAIAIGKTGVFYRRVADGHAGGNEAIQRLATSDTIIPNPGNCAPGTTFGSTAPPSAASGHVVFVGLDDESDPACGGIYLAPLAQPPEQLIPLVALGTRVPGQGRHALTRLGEGLSYDGRLVGFWGAWGNATRILRLYCPSDGNRDRRDYCNRVFIDPVSGTPGGDPDSICDDFDDRLWPTCYQEMEIPVNQGIFVYDTAASTAAQSLRLLARTGPGGRFADFVYWNYSGAPPGTGGVEGDAEPPRWRSSAYLAVSTGKPASPLRVAFLARSGEIDVASGGYVDPVDGIYLATGPGQGPLTTLIETGMPGTMLDPDAVWDGDADSDALPSPLPISSLALERDAFRSDWIVIAAGMGREEAGWGGIYLTRLPR